MRTQSTSTCSSRLEAAGAYRPEEVDSDGCPAAAADRMEARWSSRATCVYFHQTWPGAARPCGKTPIMTPGGSSRGSLPGPNRAGARCADGRRVRRPRVELHAACRGGALARIARALAVLDRFGAIVTDGRSGSLRAAASSSRSATPSCSSSGRAAPPSPARSRSTSEAAKEPQFPAVRAGIHWGDLLYREGDYVGSNVNIAARLADRGRAPPGARHRRSPPGSRTALPGSSSCASASGTLKGLGGTLRALRRARPQAPPPPKSTSIPSAAWSSTDAEVAARLALEGEDRAFCSEACLRKFVATPEAYSG